MNPSTYDFKLYQGSTFIRSFQLDTEAFDFNDYSSVRMKIRKLPESTEVIWSSTSETNGFEIVSDTLLKLTIPADVTATFDFDKAGYDIELVKAGSPEVVDKFFRGTITLVREYTK